MKKCNRLILNSIMTPDGTILVSRHRHDCVTYIDANGKEYMVDGGLEYIRCSNNGDEIYVCLFDDQPHKVQRWVLRWGTYGRDGKQLLELKPVALMDSSHIEAVLKECNPVLVYRNCMEKELKLRKKMGW